MTARRHGRTAGAGTGWSLLSDQPGVPGEVPTTFNEGDGGQRLPRRQAIAADRRQRP